jgi:putative redox protein
VISAKVLWTDNERYVAEASSRHAVVMDTASDVVGILKKKREPFTSLEVSAEGERADGYPAVYTEIRLKYRVGGKVSHKAVEDAVKLSKEKYCSVSAMLQKTAKITFEIEHLNGEAG